MADLARIKRNVAKMAAQNAPMEDIDGYIASEGVALDDVRNFRPAKVDPATNQPPGVPEFVPPGVTGYDPKSGTLAQPEHAGDGAAAYALGTIDGVPVAGPALSAIVKGSASVLPAITSDKSFGEVYDDMSQRQRELQDQHPIATTAGNLTGAVAGTLPMIAAAPAAFGAGAGGIVARSAAGSLSGAGLGGADAAVRSGGDITEIGKGGLMGFGAGLVGPTAGKVAGAGYKAVSDWLAQRGIKSLTGLAPAAVKRIAEVAQADGLDPSAIRQRLADFGPQGMIADVGPNFQQEAGRLVLSPGPARATMKNAIMDRDAGANQRILSELDSTLGPAPIPSQVDAGIRANQKALSPAYETAFRDAKAVDTKSIADALDSQVVNLRGDAQSSLKNVRNMLNVHGTDVLDPHPGALLQTRQAIDGMIDSATDGNVRRVLSAARKQVDDQLAASVPGIKDADARFAELARQRDALQRGQTLLDSGRPNAVRPQELTDEVAAGALPQGTMVGPSAVPVMLRQGARADIDRIVGTTANDRAALQRLVKGDGDWNPQKLSALFGPDKATRIMRVLDNEKTFADTSKNVIGNSLTAERTAAKEAANPSTGLGVLDAFKAGGSMGAARATGLKVAEALFGKVGQARQNAADAALALALTKPAGNKVVEALGLLQGRGTHRQEVERVARALLLAPAVGR